MARKLEDQYATKGEASGPPQSAPRDEVPVEQTSQISEETRVAASPPSHESHLEERHSSKISDADLIEKDPGQISRSEHDVRRDEQGTPTGLVLTEDGIDERIWLAHMAKEHQEAQKSTSEPQELQAEPVSIAETAQPGSAMTKHPETDETQLQPIFLFDHTSWPDLLAMVLEMDNPDILCARMMAVYVKGMQRRERPEWGDCVILEGEPEESTTGWLFFPWEPHQCMTIFSFAEYDYDMVKVRVRVPEPGGAQIAGAQHFDAITVLYRDDPCYLGIPVSTVDREAAINVPLWWEFADWSADNRIWSIAPEDPESLERARPLTYVSHT